MSKELEDAVSQYRIGAEGLSDLHKRLEALKLEIAQAEEVESMTYDKIRKLRSQGHEHPDKIFDYCFDHFKENPLAKIPVVNEFLEIIKDSQGEKIVSVIKDTEIWAGIISGEAEFFSNTHYKNLYVPVTKTKTLTFYGGKYPQWQDYSTDSMLVHNKIFLSSHWKCLAEPRDPKLQKILGGLGDRVIEIGPMKEKSWSHRHPKDQMYIGFSGPKDIHLAIGSDVDLLLKQHLIVRVPEQTKEIPLPNF